MGQYISKFSNAEEFAAFSGTSNCVKPHVSLTKNDGKVHYLKPQNIIKYKAPNKLEETTSDKNAGGLHTNQFNSEIVSHTFANGIGVITFEENVTSIGIYAFYKADTMTSIILPDSVNTIVGDDTLGGAFGGAFQGCSGLTSINIPSGVTNIGGGAFSGCTSLPIENNIRYADTYAVEAVDKTLTTYTLKSGTKLLGATFSGCESLTSITIPNSVTSIGYNAFNNCDRLTSITIPSGVTSIGNSAFQSCERLTSITIPSGVTSIGDEAFDFCTSLTSITIPNSVTSIGQQSFRYCYLLTSIDIPNSVTTIGDNAFEECYGLTSIDIPNSVTSIGTSPFFGCASITSITVDDNNSTYDSRNNCNAVIETSSNTLVGGCKNTVIPNTTTSIGDGAFDFCTSLTSITIPNSVTSIGNYAFRECTSLTSCTIGSGVTSIGNGAFETCRSLTSINIPSGVTDIGSSAFYGCSSLTSIVSNATTAPTIVSTTFQSVKTDGTLTVPIGSSGYDVWMGTGDYYLGKYNWTKVEQ